MKTITSTLLGLSLLLLTPACLARNIILFIGDGMGFEHVQAGRLYTQGSTGGGLAFEGLPFHGQAVTTLPGGVVTDSATAGTALATGYQHPYNGAISTDTAGNPVETILEKAKSLGWRTGIITTDDIGGATPGSFGAHEPDRNLMAEIRADYLVDDSNHPASLPNVLFGGGASETYSTFATSVGYTVVKTAAGLNGLNLLTLSQPRLLGQFAVTTFTRENDRLSDNPEPRLSEMVRRGLELLSQEPIGFFLIVEGALIDKLSHENASNDLCPEMAQFDLAFQEAQNWVMSNGGFGNTLLFVTADHETGGLNVPDNQVVEPGTPPAFTWSSLGHTSADVPAYASWPPAMDGARIDNTEVFFVMEDWLAGAAGHPPVVAGLTVESVKQTSASVTWTTLEPATGRIECDTGGSLVASGSDSTRATVHQFSLAGLLPDTDYQVRISSVDLSGFTGTEVISFRTASPDVDAYVQAEPEVTLGSVVGSYTAVAAPGDGQTQTITEDTTGIGSGLDATYTLHTTAPVNSILGVTLNVGFTWTARDRGQDDVTLSVQNVVSGKWELATVNSGGSFALTPPLAYVDGGGDVRVRVVDTALIRREKKDVLTIDWLQADVEAGPPDTEAPLAPSGFAVASSGAEELTAFLTWDVNTAEDLAGYLVRRNDWTEAVFTTTPGYTDLVKTGGIYSYAVAAVDLSDNISKWTDWATVELVNQYPPSAPVNLQAQATDGEVLLTWNQNLEWDVIGYKVFLEQGGEWVQLGEEIVSNSYSHSDLVNGQTYRYSVTAFDSSLDSLLSDSVEATPSVTPKVWVDSIAVSLQSSGKNWKATAAIQVLSDGQPAAGATVTGDWLLNDQPLVSGATAATDTTGATSLTSVPVKVTSGTFMFRVTNVVMPGYAYDPTGHETEGSVAIGP